MEKSGSEAGTTVHLYSICWNELPILKFFFRHYEPWVDVFHIFDDGSDDGKREFLAARSDVVLEDFTRTDPDSFERSKNAHENGIWKGSRGIADWVLMVDMDVHHADMPRYLRRQYLNGVSVIPALGYDMILEAPPLPVRISQLVTAWASRRYG